MVSPKSVKLLREPKDKEQTALITNNGNITITQAFFLLRLNFPTRNAITTSPKDTVEVHAATTRRKKNNNDQTYEPSIFAKICGKVLKIKVEPSVEPSIAKDFIAGNIIKPTNIATKKTKEVTVREVRPNLVVLG